MICIPHGKPYVRKTCHISPPRALFYGKWWGAYLKILKKLPKKELESGFVRVAPIHLKPHPRGSKKPFE